MFYVYLSSNKDKKSSILLSKWSIMFWSICLLHLNKLPLRRVMDYCLGSTKSADDRDGEVYDVLKRVYSLEF